VTGLWPSLLAFGGLCLAASGAGWIAAGAIFPADRRFRAERLGWSFAIGCGLLAASAAAAMALRSRPGPVWAGVALVLGAALGVLLRAPSPREQRARSRGALSARSARAGAAALTILAAGGVLLYALRALTEPMWSNDFLAIWGLKGKAIFGAGTLPDAFYRSPDLAFSHPEYPLGLPLLYAGISASIGRWDDHAMAVLFPLAQVATLLVLAGWIRRRGGSLPLSFFAAALVAWFAPLYSAFGTGMADVPLALAALLLGTALADASDGSDPAALRRLALASALAAAVKNEGLFLAAAGGAILLVFPRRGSRLRPALAAVAPAFAVRALQLPWRSRLPLADFDLSSFSLGRIGESLAAAVRVPRAAGWAGIALAALLLLLGSRCAAAGRLLALCGCALAAYLLLPAFAVRGPEWLVRTTLDRTVSALVPLAAAAIALRLRDRREVETPA